MQTAFNQFLLDFYGLVRAEPSQNFSAAALELLKRGLPFDTGLWGAQSDSDRLQQARGALESRPAQARRAVVIRAKTSKIARLFRAWRASSAAG
jgi:hypothetical protein